MKEFFKGIASALAAALFLLCPAPTVFATAESAEGIAVVEDLEADSSGIRETVSGNITGTASVTEPAMKRATGPATEPATASTQEELLAWLKEHERGEGTLKLTADIFLEDLIYMNASRKNITIDTGEFSIVAVGEVYFWCSGLTVRGRGGEKGVLRAAEGSAFSIGHMSLVAEEGFAAFQEEGAGLTVTQCAVSGNAVHYAQTPFVWRWRSSLVVVSPGQTASDILPRTVTSYDVNRQGQMYTEDVPVAWKLEEYASSQTQRLRFDTEGNAPGFAFLRAPVCTVVYDDFPLTFLNVSATKTEREDGACYQFLGFFSTPEDRLPFTITQEYSFDGENWTLYEENTITDPNDSFSIFLSAGMWDAQSFPEIFIRIGWNDNGTVYYSNVLCFAEDRLEKAEDHGGNRGGGTDIINPSGPPEPDQESSPDAEPAPDLLPSPDPEPAPEPETAHPSAGQPEGTGAGPETEPLPHPTSEPKPAVSAAEPSEDPKRLSPARETEEVEKAAQELRRSVKSPEIPAVSDRTAGPSSSGETADSWEGAKTLTEPETSRSSAEAQGVKASAQPQAKPAAATQGPGVLPVVAGLGTVTVSFAGAALCLHPKAWKGLVRRLRSILRQ